MPGMREMHSMQGVSENNCNKSTRIRRATSHRGKHETHQRREKSGGNTALHSGSFAVFNKTSWRSQQLSSGPQNIQVSVQET